MSVKPEINDAALFNVFGEEHDRFKFPANIHRVTSGDGGESFLILGSEKTALYDCGMAYCGRFTVENIRSKLDEYGRDSLDYILLSHSHYDHMGALPYIRKAFPEAVVYGGEKAKNILTRPNAKKLIKELGEAARDLFMPGNREEILVDDLEVDVVIREGDVISLGDEQILVMETKGHTDCSMSYALEPLKLLFASESTGIIEGRNYVHTPFLKDYNDSMESMRKCMAYDAEYLCLPHFGLLPKDFNQEYWDMLNAACRDKLEFIRNMKNRQLTDEEMLDRYVEHYWSPDMDEIQPKEAFVINSRAIIKSFSKAV